MTKHLQIGWWSLLLFLSAGVLLEALHGFKALLYLGGEAEMRRLMWRLAHAHGALLSLVHIAFGLTLVTVWKTSEPGARLQARLRLASRSLMAALLLLPGGFFASGTILVHGEPNPAILLVPLGALFLFVAVALVALAVSSKPTDPSAGGQDI